MATELAKVEFEVEWIRSSEIKIGKIGMQAFNRIFATIFQKIFLHLLLYSSEGSVKAPESRPSGIRSFRGRMCGLPH